MAKFDLTKNPFVALRTSPRAKRAEIEDAYQDALLDAQDASEEAALNKALQALISPKERIESELAFFIDASPSTAKAALAGAGDPSFHPDDLIGGLDLANFFAHQCNALSGDSRVNNALKLINSYDDVLVSPVSEALNATRLISGFGLIDEASVKTELSKLARVHSKIIHDSLLSEPVGLAKLAELSANLSDVPPQRRSLLELLLQDYETNVASQLEAAADRVRAALEQVLAAPLSPEYISLLDTELTNWDELAQPLQNADRARGIDERHSNELFRDVREACLRLANDDGYFKQALEISGIASRVFSELPEASAKLAEDVEALRGIVAIAEAMEQLENLLSLLEKGKKRLASVGSILRKSGFQSKAKSPVGPIYDEFIRLVETNDAQVGTAAGRVILNLAIELSNECEDNAAAVILCVEVLRLSASMADEFVQKLGSNLKTLQDNADFAAAKSAVQRNAFHEAEIIIDRMIERSDDENLATLLGMKNVIAARRRERFKTMIGWAVVVAIGFGIVALSDGRENDQVYPDPAEDISVTAPSATPPIETPPSPNLSGSTLTLPELRYCERQGARLEKVQNRDLSNEQIARYNAAVEDFNSRCQNARYNVSDMNELNSEYADESNIEEEALSIVGDR